MSDFLIVVDDDVMLQRIGQVLNLLQHPQSLMQSIGAVLKTNVERRFETKTDPNGQQWAPLSEITPTLYWTIDKQRRASLKKDADGSYIIPSMPGSLLQRTNYMLESLTPPHATDDSVELGFTRPYAKWHETGTKIMPRRGMLTADPKEGRLGAQDQQDILDEVESFIASALGGS